MSSQEKLAKLIQGSSIELARDDEYSSLDNLSKPQRNIYDVNELDSRPKQLWQKLKHIIRVQDKESLTTLQLFLFNHDLKPVESARRTWTWFNFVCFWIADSFNVNTWQIAATGVQAGLTWWEVFITVWLGYFFCGVFVSMSARIGAFYHISFPVSCRASFGIFGSLWPVINRVVMAIIWYSVQGWIGGQCVQLMLKSIFGTDLDTRIPNHVGMGINSFQFLSFFLFWLFSLPAIYFPPHQIRHLFTAKAYVVPFAGVGFLIWTIKKAGGIGPVVHQPATIHGSERSWAFVNSFMNSLANFATLIVNAPDFSRFSKTKNSSIYSQLIAIPVCFSITSLIGILVSSASTSMYGETYWSPLDVLGHFLDTFTRGERGGVFLISFAFAIAQLGTNISANSLSAGTDMTALLPAYINIRRGGFICATLSLVICPWQFFSSSNNFTTYLSAYAVFLSAIAGTVASDYFAIRKGYIILSDLYSGKRTSCYRYNTLGVNWRAYVAYISGIIPNMTGFAGACGRDVPLGATRVYDLSFFVGFFTSFLIYYGLCLLFPVQGLPEPDAHRKNVWYEEWQEVEDFDASKEAYEDKHIIEGF